MILVTTTPSVDGYTITNYQGIVFGEVVSGVNMFKDLGAGLRNMFGGRSQGYEEELMRARNEAIAEMQQRAEAMGAHAVVGVDIDCFASMFVRQVRQCFSAVWADGFPRCRHRFPVM